MAREIYLRLNGDCGGQLTKLTRTEQVLIEAIRVSGRTEFTVKQMQKLIGRAQSTISRLLAGNPNLQNHLGLLEKCPPLSFYDRSEPREDGGYQRGRVYTWNYEMDEIWSAGVSCWLDESDAAHAGTDPDDDPDDAMHVCTPMQGLCTPECIDSEHGDKSFSDMTDEKTILSPAMHTPERACTTCQDEMNAVYIPENCAYNNTKSIITQDLQGKKDVPVHSSMHEGMHTACIDVHTMHLSEKELDENRNTDEKFRIEDINPGMFLMTERVHTQSCDSCGKAGVQYREKGTGKTPQGQKKRMICKRCYSKAVSREVLTFRALPGVLPLNTMTRTSRSLGRCHLCSLHPITWFDEETKTGLCERCYYRERFSSRTMSFVVTSVREVGTIRLADLLLLFGDLAPDSLMLSEPGIRIAISGKYVVLVKQVRAMIREWSKKKTALFLVREEEQGVNTNMKTQIILYRGAQTPKLEH